MTNQTFCWTILLLSILVPTPKHTWGDEVISLFDGKSFEGWVTLDDQPVTKGWTIENGTIHVKFNKERAGYIKTKQLFENFDLEFEWRIAAGGNSGLKYLAKESQSGRGRRYFGCEYQLLDDEKHKNGRTPSKTAGALYDLYPPEIKNKTLKPIGEFNHSRILVDNGRIEHWLNGDKLLTATIGDNRWNEKIRQSKFNQVQDFAIGPGAIMLQEHLSDVWFRNIRIRRLPKKSQPKKPQSKKSQSQKPVETQTKQSRPNVLFIAVDDLRPELGCYQHKLVKSPNIDRLASRGLVFDRAYCQQAICMSSRASLLSGYRPDKGRIYQNGPLFKHVPDALTLNQHFLNNGYTAVCMGKIYHHSSDYQVGWSRPVFRPTGKWAGRGYLTDESKRVVAEYTRANPKSKRKGMGPAFEAADVEDNEYSDGMIADRAIAELKRLRDQPFFLAVGFVRPHLPFNAPKKYWDLYDEADIALAANPFPTKKMSTQAGTGWGELRGYHGMPRSGPMPDKLARKLIHGYYASVSYVDALIGKILNELDRLELADNTIVILWGDHGWKLGEHGMWCKHTNFEIDTHVPLILRVPSMKAAGQRTVALTEFVDIYPTLCELAGLESPSHLQGTSMAPLLDDPNRSWKKAAFSQYPRGKTMGYSMRTERYRYTQWQDIKTKKVLARELYDLQQDPQSNHNVAGAPQHEELVETLAEQLQAGYLAATPDQPISVSP